PDYVFRSSDAIHVVEDLTRREHDVIYVGDTTKDAADIARAGAAVVLFSRSGQRIDGIRLVHALDSISETSPDAIVEGAVSYVRLHEKIGAALGELKQRTIDRAT